MTELPRLPVPAVTLQTIADKLGVSRTTVSNAYGRPDQLNPELRARILAAAKELGYPGPHAGARSLRRGRAGAVGVLLGGNLAYAFTDPAAVLLFQGLAETTGEAGLGLLLLPAPRDGPCDPAAVREAVVDAFVVWSVAETTPALRAIVERGLPTVCVEEPRLPGLPFVGIDDRGGARTAAAHLLALGHRRLAVVAALLTADRRFGPADRARQAATTNATVGARLAGYADAVRAAGRSWDAVPVQEAPENTIAAGCAAGAALLDRSPRPTAILTISDQLALGVLAAARQRGIAVPGALSVVGFDDIPAAETAVPPLTTVRQPLLEKGRLAGRLLLVPPAAAATILPTELVVRASTGPAPGGDRPPRTARHTRLRDPDLDPDLGPILAPAPNSHPDGNGGEDRAPELDRLATTAPRPRRSPRPVGRRPRCST